MAAHDHLGRQFMRPHEIMAMAEPQEADVAHGESHEEFYARTLVHARHTGLLDSIREHGVLTPVQIENDSGYHTVFDGVHRLAVAHHLEQAEGRTMNVPYEYVEDDD